MIGDQADRPWIWLANHQYPRRHRPCGKPLVVIFHFTGPAYRCTECDATELIRQQGHRFTSLFPKPRELVDRVLTAVAV